MGIVGNSCPLAHFSQAYFATYNFIFEARGNACAPDSARNFFSKKPFFRKSKSNESKSENWIDFNGDILYRVVNIRVNL